MEIEPKNQSRNFRSEKFVCSDFLAEWKTAFSLKSVSFNCLNDDGILYTSQAYNCIDSVKLAPPS